VTLPLLFGFPLIRDEQANYLFLATVSVAIAIAAGLRNFYGWDNNWRLYRSQEQLLAGLVAQWEVALLRILQEDTAGADLAALEVTAETLARLAEAFDYENTTLFSAVVPPEEIKRRFKPTTPPAPPAQG